MGKHAELVKLFNSFPPFQIQHPIKPDRDVGDAKPGDGGIAEPCASKQAVSLKLDFSLMPCREVPTCSGVPFFSVMCCFCPLAPGRVVISVIAGDRANLWFITLSGVFEAAAAEHQRQIISPVQHKCHEFKILSWRFFFF